MASWQDLPDIILAQIFTYLSIFDRTSVSRVCQSWKRASWNPRAWTYFHYGPEYSMKPMLLHHSEHDLDEFHIKLQEYIHNVGNHFRVVTFVLSDSVSIEIFDQISLFCHGVQKLKITRVSEIVKGTMVRQALWSLIENNKDMKEATIESVNFQLKQKNIPLPFGPQHARNLKYLNILNSFGNNSLSNLMYLVNLKSLTLNPNTMQYSLIKHLAGHSLEMLKVRTDRKSRDFYFENMRDDQWQEITRIAPKLRVCFHFDTLGFEAAETELIMKASVPCESVVHHKLHPLWFKSVAPLLANYSNTLTTFIDHTNLYVRTPGTSLASQNLFLYETRNDKYILQIIKSCPKLETFGTKELISSATVILVAYFNSNLKHFYVKKTSILYRNDVPMEQSWSAGVLEVLDKQSTSFENMCQAVSEYLKYDWQPSEPHDWDTCCCL